MCVCVCARACVCCCCCWEAVFHLSMFDSVIDIFCVYNFIKILSSFLTGVSILSNFAFT